ncbi:MAG TPA: LLM class flavin-dependent oxidoreductase [Candidatus Limnocylindrales bacterium]|nr:LLM class flavin-dependent oxidoreductase [Candidatus Limnocylindrales bacterium]
MTRHIPIGIKTSPQAIDWPTLDAAWARIGEHGVFESVWMNDHLTDISRETHGPSFEALTAMAALVHHVPGRWVGHAVLSATFRHPAVLAKSATVLDHATGGRFIVGLGAGWHEGEHLPFGIPMPPMPERFDRFESAVHVLKALWSGSAAVAPGVTRPDPWYPLVEATNEPPPLTPGGPPLWLGGQKPRGIALAAAMADGWALPTVVGLGNPTDLTYFSEKRELLITALEAIGRDPATFEFSAQVPTGTTADDRRWALGQALEAAHRGATHIVLGMTPRLGPAGVDAIARDVAEPLRVALDALSAGGA